MLLISNNSGCQVILKKDLEGAEFTLPQATRNYYVDGHKPTPHWMKLGLFINKQY